jgi:CubicO group peptidase (beta-lactamase class C family)
MPVMTLGAQSATDSLMASRVDAYVIAQLHAQHIPGISLGVARDGQLIKTSGYGLANIELDVPVTPASVFQTGSVGKQFTAMAVMMLVEAGKVRLGDPITKYLREAPAAWRGITVRHLLTHTSGIPDYAPVINFRMDYTEGQLVRRFARLPLDFPPGTKWSYSNTGYVLLGVLIHRVSGQFYGDFLRDRVFVPLGMTATHIISEADIVPHRTSGYRLVKGEIKNQEWVAPSLNTTADGALYTNAFDLAKWDAALYEGKFLTKASFDQMWTPVTLKGGGSYPYGFGWGVTRVNNHRVLEHGGAWQGFTMQIDRYVDDRLTVIVFTNLDENNSHPDRIARGVAALYIPALVADSAPKP